MKNLFEAASTAEVKTRLANLRPDSPRIWGKMTSAQAVAHCASALEVALGDKTLPPVLVGRILGRVIKPFVFRNDDPIRRNAPTMKSLEVTDQRDLNRERERLQALISRFADAGPQGCTKDAHSFFGQLTPEEWAILMYKDLDHHLRQFGV